MTCQKKTFAAKTTRAPKNAMKTSSAAWSIHDQTVWTTSKDVHPPAVDES